MITYIDINKLYPHPNNPRKDLGDLTELADSIRANGIMQNLTVVPFEGQYRVVIGHRRLAAAKLAGLKIVPCVVSNMTKQEQIATMLLENMQRSDLTVYEQAQGFQMMLDFGESIVSISEKTGFSETTIRQRVKLLELDQEKFKKSQERGGTLQDYIKLNKIEDINLRNEVLEHIGTNNFEWELQNAIQQEKSEKNKARLIEQLKQFATQIEDNNGDMVTYRVYNPTYDEEVRIPEDHDSTEYFFHVSEYGLIRLYKKWEQSENNSVENEKNKMLEERRTALKELTKRAYQLRKNFICGISYAEAKKYTPVIMEFAVRALLEKYYGAHFEDFAKIFEINITEKDEWEFEDITEKVATQPERYLMVAIYCTYESYNSDDGYCKYWNCSYKKNADLNVVYNLLEKLGYEMSDEEKQLRDGTHELFIVNEE